MVLLSVFEGEFKRTIIGGSDEGAAGGCCDSRLAVSQTGNLLGEYLGGQNLVDLVWNGGTRSAMVSPSLHLFFCKKSSWFKFF